MTPKDRVVLGTRGSKLALIQAEFCAEELRGEGVEVEVRVIKTTSEHHPEVPLSVIDQRDVFTRQLDEALLSGEVDLAVHSLKDIPTELPEGIAIAAVPGRHEPFDVLVSEERRAVEDLSEGATVATSSLRRRAQLLHLRPDLKIVGIRGNVDTRIRKMRDGAADALVLAGAGIWRLGLEVPHKILPPETMLPAVGQGALAVAALEDHPLRGQVSDTLNHGPTERATRSERAMLRALEGGCRVPVGGWAVAEKGKVRLRGVVVSPDGALVYRGETEGTDPEQVGETLASDLLQQGAEVVLGEVREARA